MFYSFLKLNSLATSSNAVLSKESEENGHPFLVPDHEENTLIVILHVSLSYICQFFCVGYASYILTWSLYHEKEMLNLT